MTKRIMSLLVCLCMALTLLPANVALAATNNYTMAFASTNPLSWYSGYPPINYSTEDASGSGWSWKYRTKTLTLSGLNFATDQEVAIIVPDGATIELASGTTSTIQSGISSRATLSNIYTGIWCQGALTIEGSGVLFAASDDPSSVPPGYYRTTIASGIHANTSLVIKGGTIHATGGAVGSNGTSRGIYAPSIRIDGGTVLASGHSSAIHQFALAPTGMTVTGSTTPNASGNALGSVIWDATNKNYYIGSVSSANIAKTLKLAPKLIEADIPKTGDGNTPLLWLGLALLAVAGLAGNRLALKKRRGSNP